MTNQRKNKGVALTRGAPWRGIFLFAMPILLGSLLQQLYHTVDAMMVGLLISERALSAVGTCGVLTNLFLAFSVGFSTGTSVISAQLFGAEKKGEITRNAYASLVFLLALGVGLGMLGLATRKMLLRYLVSVPPALLPQASRYFEICALGIVFQFMYNAVAALLRSIGDSKASLYFLALSAAANILLDYVFLAYFDLGVAGAAWATVLSQALACVVSYIYMQHNYEVFRFWGKRIRVGMRDILLLLRTGIPMALQSMVGTVFNLFIQRLVNSFGEAMTASYAVVSRVEGYMHLPTNTLNQAMATYTAQNVGAGNQSRIRAGLRQTVAMACGITFVLSIVTFFFAESIAAAFGISGTAARFCAAHIRCLSFPFLLFALYYPCTGLYQGVGKGFVSTALSTAFLALCLLFGYALQYIPAVGMASVWICKPITWVIIVPINYLYYWKGNWQKQDLCNSSEGGRTAP